MKSKKNIFFALFLLIAMLISGCSKDGILKKGTYIGKTGTIQIIEVNSSDEWIIKERNKSDENFIVTSVTKIGEEIEGYPIIELKAKQIIGNIRDSFAPREGRQYIVAENDKEIYFMLAEEKARDEKKQDLKEAENKVEYIKEHAKFTFKK